MTDFHGEPTRITQNQFVRLEIIPNAGRIIRFAPHGGKNIFADLGLSPISTPYGNFYFRGGHRLWHSPEAMPRTYLPDNEGGIVSEITDGLRIEMPAEPWTNLAKCIEIRLNPERPQVILRHELRNDGAWAAKIAPWALTMFQPGGIGIFPQPVGNVDDSGLLANRHFSFWPYTRLNDPRLILRDDFVLVRATAGRSPMKLGYFNPHGWAGYWLDGTLFVKRFDAQSNIRYPDHGCNTECYCSDQFIELESLGPLTDLQPGMSVLHTEIWEVYDSLDVSLLSDEIRNLILGMNV